MDILSLASEWQAFPQALQEKYAQLLGGDNPLYRYMLNTSFFSDPASTRFHGASFGGLSKHSMGVLWKSLQLQPILAPDTDIQSLISGCLGHDLCKVGMYKSDFRNVKDEKGVWQRVPCYTIIPKATIGHGAESLYILQGLGVKLTKGWEMAVRWHMGNYDATVSDGYAMQEAMKQFPEVLLLQTADLYISHLNY